MHRDMFKIQDGVAIVEELNYQLPLRHRPQYKTEWMFEFIKTLNNFGLPRVKEYERRHKIGLKRFYFKLKVYVDKNLVS